MSATLSAGCNNCPIVNPSIECPTFGYNQGFYLALHSDPSPSDIVISGGNGPSPNFDGYCYALTENTTYYFRAFFSNFYETVVGEVNSFTTLEPPKK